MLALSCKCVIKCVTASRRMRPGRPGQYSRPLRPTLTAAGKPAGGPAADQGVRPTTMETALAWGEPRMTRSRPLSNIRELPAGR